MAFKLTKPETKERDTLITALRDARETLDDAAEAYESARQIAFATLVEARDEYNVLLAEAREWCDGIAGRLSDEIEEKSETWRDGARGTAAVSMLEQWQQVDLAEATFEEPDPIELSDLVDAADSISELPEEMD